jgi:hypothetical protein
VPILGKVRGVPNLRRWREQVGTVGDVFVNVEREELLCVRDPSPCPSFIGRLPDGVISQANKERLSIHSDHCHGRMKERETQTYTGFLEELVLNDGRLKLELEIGLVGFVMKEET